MQRSKQRLVGHFSGRCLALNTSNVSGAEINSLSSMLVDFPPDGVLYEKRRGHALIFDKVGSSVYVSRLTELLAVTAVS